MTSTSLEQARHYSRRSFLRAGSISALGLGIPHCLSLRATAVGSQSHRPTAKACILLYMIGGPPQHETYDMKPAGDSAMRGEFSPIPTAVPGTNICEHLPKMARLADQFTIVRSLHHDGGGFHAAGVHYNLTGRMHAPRGGQPLLDRRDSPSVGAVLQQLEPHDAGELPTSVQLPMWITQDGPGQEWAGQDAGFLGPRFDPLILDYKGQPPGTLPDGFTPREQNAGRRLEQRRDLLRNLDRSNWSGLTPLDRRWSAVQRESLDVLRSPEKWWAFCLDDEAPRVRDRYGDHHYGRSCLIARRLVEAGVRLVTVAWPITPDTSHFDTHAGNFPTMKKLSPVMDQGTSALLADLGDRGMLDETLVVQVGEFGRTPVINPNGGRDHWPSVYSGLLAGGGIRGGRVYGSSDKNGAEPKDNPVHARDFVATIYHALGYDANTRVVDFQGRPSFIVAGRPVRALFA
ncbi:MAG: DUF1501 domain-containing protein [Pirellulaceae bacterium]|jgi:hypothetical protein|nr:DUF1501 domain-containing protein [Pirellulaceae bacterium]MDP7017327.1 DUF1501 domain-containing protein [Pirellulaceae bacterium]